MTGLARTNNGCGYRWVPERPGNGDLSWCGTVAGCNGAQDFDQLKIPLERGG